MKNGSYSKHLKGTLAEAFAEAASQKPELNEEFTLLRAFLIRSLALLSAAEKSGLAQQMIGMELCRGIIRDVADIRQTIHRIESSDAITPAQVSIVIEQIISVLQSELDDKTMKRVTDRLKTCSWPGGVATGYNPNMSVNASARRQFAASIPNDPPHVDPESPIAAE